TLVCLTDDTPTLRLATPETRSTTEDCHGAASPTIITTDSIDTPAAAASKSHSIFVLLSMGISTETTAFSVAVHGRDG
ncbi:hypothetical protein FS837_007400, partial [Tulasnella sp. UAMH 9824]